MQNTAVSAPNSTSPPPTQTAFDLLSRIMPKTTLPSSSPSSMNSSTTTKVVTVSGSKSSKSSRGRCNTCGHEFSATTLERNNGTCGRCLTKTTKGGKMVKGSDKGNCTVCEREYTQRTLEKNKGICGKCIAKEGTKEEPSKAVCLLCSKETNGKTAKKYNGFCHPCVISVCKYKFGTENNPGLLTELSKMIKDEAAAKDAKEAELKAAKEAAKVVTTTTVIGTTPAPSS